MLLARQRGRLSLKQANLEEVSMVQAVKRYQHVTVKLVGQDGNAFVLIGLTTRALRRAGVPKDEVDAVRDRLMNAGSYDDLLCELMETVNVE
jgi:hypothetical protein